MVTTRQPGPQTSQGERLLSAVERLADDCGTLIADVEAHKAAADVPRGDGPLDRRQTRLVARRIITGYSNRSAVSGGVTALPGMLPGAGSAIALVGGTLVDITLMLKHEVEMVLCLSYLYGHDIRDESERLLAYVMAGVRVYEARAGRSYFEDLVEVQLDALPRYAPRQLFKLAGTVFGRVLLVSASKGLIKTVPLLGIAISASTNKLTTATVGWWCVDALERRKALRDRVDPAPVDAVVE